MIEKQQQDAQHHRKHVDANRAFQDYTQSQSFPFTTGNGETGASARHGRASLPSLPFFAPPYISLVPLSQKLVVKTKDRDCAQSSAYLRKLLRVRSTWRWLGNPGLESLAGGTPHHTRNGSRWEMKCVTQKKIHSEGQGGDHISQLWRHGDGLWEIQPYYVNLDVNALLT